MINPRIWPIVGAWLAALSLAAAASPAGSWRSDVGCGVDRPRPVPTELPNCEKALCGDAAPLQSRICACQKSENSIETEITIRGVNGAVRKLNTEIPPIAFGDDSFRFIRGDFVGDGGSHVLLAAVNGTSNGMGVESWSLWLIGPDSLSGSLSVSDFGVMSFLTTSSHGKCKIFTSNWRAGWEPQRGHGLYVYGQWYEGSSFGELSTDQNRPALYRGYLFELENQRIEALSSLSFADAPPPCSTYCQPC